MCCRAVRVVFCQFWIIPSQTCIHRIHNGLLTTNVCKASNYISKHNVSNHFRPLPGLCGAGNETDLYAQVEITWPLSGFIANILSPVSFWGHWTLIIWCKCAFHHMYSAALGMVFVRRENYVTWIWKRGHSSLTKKCFFRMGRNSQSLCLPY